MTALPPARHPLSPFVFCLLVPCGLVGLIVFALIGLRVAGFIEPFQIPSSGMAPTICKGDQFAGQSVSLAFRPPRRGEIVFFDSQKVPPLAALPGPAGMWVQRVVALPGDRFQVKDGQVWINGVRAADLGERKYVAADSQQAMSGGLDITKETIVPDGQYIVLGDNTANSLDSRFWGLLPKASIKFVYWFSYWRNRDRSTAAPKH